MNLTHKTTVTLVLDQEETLFLVRILDDLYTPDEFLTKFVDDLTTALNKVV